MSQARLEWKVGLFVVIGLVVLAALMINFSKGISPFTPTYDLLMRSENVGGIISGAKVKMSGVNIGHVEAIELDQQANSVRVRLKILREYPIYQGAQFRIETSGFLGDQFVSVSQQETQGEPLQDGDVVYGEAPFDFQATARSAAGLLERVDNTATKLNEAVERIDQTLLAESTLVNLTNTVENFRLLSKRALHTVEGLDRMLVRNQKEVGTGVSNLVTFTHQLNDLADELQTAVASNRVALRTTMKHFQSSAVHVEELLGELQQGKGLVGKLLKDDALESDFTQTVSNLNSLIGNLNQYGIFYKPKSDDTNRVTLPDFELYPGKTPFP